MPAAYQQLSSAFKAINPELEEASRILGATRVGTLWKLLHRCFERASLLRGV